MSDPTNHTVTHVTHQSYGSRMRDSCKGMVLGPILVVVAIVLMVWNEGNTVTAHRSLEEASRAAHNLPSPEKVDPLYEGTLVHLVGRAQTPNNLKDDPFGVTPSQNYLWLQRQVEMYQWQEQKHSKTQTNSGGGSTTHTTYSYDKIWSSQAISSDDFQNSDGHENPGSLPFPSNEDVADPIQFGAFTFGTEVSSLMQSWYVDYPEKLSVENIPNENIRKQAHLVDNNKIFYIGENPTTPAVGDTRISWQVVPQQTVSLLAQQMGSTFGRYQAKAGHSILLLEPGTHSAAEMIANAQSQATALAWILRFVGFVLVYVGFLAMVRPLTMMVDVVPWMGPFLGDTLQGVTSCILFPVALLVSLVVIALSWVAYRPLLAGSFLAALAGGCYVYYRHKKQRPATTTDEEGPIVHAYAVLEDQEEDIVVSPPPPTAPHHATTAPALPVDLELQETTTTEQVPLVSNASAPPAEKQE